MVTIENLLELLALHGGKIVSTASLDTNSIENARVTERMYVDSNSLGFVWEPNFYGGGVLFMIPETEEEVAWFDKWFPVCPPLPEKLKFENMFPSCEGAKCKIKNCLICKNEMY